MKAALHHAAVALRKATSVVVCAHVRPDGDAIGSTLALTLALRDIGVHAIPTLADARPASATYSWLPGFSLYTAASDLEPPSHFVALDTPIPDRLGVARELSESAGTLLVIDHHPDATEYGDVHVLDSSAAATGQLVWRLLDALDAPRTPETALCCYTALLTDTGRFQYQNTSPDALRAAAEMIEAGVDPSEAARLIYHDRSAGSLALEARAMTPPHHRQRRPRRLLVGDRRRLRRAWSASRGSGGPAGRGARCPRRGCDRAHAGAGRRGPSEPSRQELLRRRWSGPAFRGRRPSGCSGIHVGFPRRGYAAARAAARASGRIP